MQKEYSFTYLELFSNFVRSYLVKAAPSEYSVTSGGSRSDDVWRLSVGKE